MATPADQRLLELLENWLKSLELHLRYSSLDDASYWKIQPWVEHQRPSRWIIDLAKQKAIALRTQVQERVKMGDTKFSDSLELMTFLANLVGSEHIERFIPMAEPDSELPIALDLPDESTATARVAVTATREMPKFVPAKTHAPVPTANAQVARTERKAAVAVKPAARPAVKQPAKAAVPVKQVAKAAPRAAAAPAPSDRPGVSEAARERVIADAARLVQWGRKWYELAELIARMADRPSLPDVRRILKDNKSAIDEMAARDSRVP